MKIGVSERQRCVLAAARLCIGTPWHHQARVPGVGMDCLGLLAICGEAAGMTVQDRTNYSRRENGTELLAAMRAHGSTQVPLTDVALADVVLFRIGGVPHHAGIISSVDPLLFIHVPSIGPRRCMETSLVGMWLALVHSVWRMPDE